MPVTGRPDGATTGPVPLLFLIADTGGGHRSAARAVGQALELRYPGRFAPVWCDPLGGPGSARLLRWITGLYGPAIRLAPWLWGAAFHASNSRPAMALLGRTLLRLANGPAAAAAAAARPAAIVSFHPLTCAAAVWAGNRGAPRPAVVSVVTDLVTVHAAWRHADVDLLVAPRAAVRGRGRRARPAGGRALAGPPVTRDFWDGPLGRGERAALRRSLGLSESRLLVLLVGGGEGGGRIGRRAAAILRRSADVDAVAVCGRNLRLKRRLDRLAARSGGRLTVLGFAPSLADWLRCADLVVTKAGPATIAEAACCGAPLLLTSHLPGQEKGNTEFVTGAGAGRQVRGVRHLVSQIVRLRDDRAAVEAMRAASARLGRPDDAAGIAELIGGLLGAAPPAGPVPVGIVPASSVPAGSVPAGAVPARAGAAGTGAARQAGGTEGDRHGPG